MRALRTFLLLAVWLVTSCGALPRTLCDGRDDQITCGSGGECLWVHLGANSGYYCTTTCAASSACPASQSCKENAASSCDVCQDLVSICD